MIDGLNLDQLRVFVTIADKGSFSAAARELRRAQSAISNAVVNLEGALSVSLFDRSGWKPMLTAHGEALLPDARAVLARTDQFKARAQSLTQGVEPELSIVIDVMYPMAKLVELVRCLQQAFPAVVIRLCTEVLGGVPERVLSGEYDLGIQGSLPEVDEALISHTLPSILLVPVAAPEHPLSPMSHVSSDELKNHTQVVLTDHSGRTAKRTFSVFGSHRILTADLGSKHAMLKAGLGWGLMPRSVVDEDIAASRLVELDLADHHARSRSLSLMLIYRRAKPPGPAGQWVIDRLSN